MRTAPNLVDSLRCTVAGRSRNRVEQQHSGEKSVLLHLSAAGLHYVPVNAGSQQLC